jgi:hypothetical protein
MENSFKLKVEKARECWGGLDLLSRKKMFDSMFGDDGYPFQVLYEDWEDLIRGYDKRKKWFKSFVENLNSF